MNNKKIKALEQIFLTYGVFSLTAKENQDINNVNKIVYVSGNGKAFTINTDGTYEVEDIPTYILMRGTSK